MDLFYRLEMAPAAYRLARRLRKFRLGLLITARGCDLLFLGEDTRLLRWNAARIQATAHYQKTLFTALKSHDEGALRP